MLWQSVLCSRGKNANPSLRSYSNNWLTEKKYNMYKIIWCCLLAFNNQMWETNTYQLFHFSFTLMLHLFRFDCRSTGVPTQYCDCKFISGPVMYSQSQINFCFVCMFRKVCFVLSLCWMLVRNHTYILPYYLPLFFLLSHK